MTSTHDKFIITVSVILILATMIIGVSAYLVANDPESAHNKQTVCKQEAHNLGFRYIDYDWEFDECWAQQPDGSIVDLFKEENT